MGWLTSLWAFITYHLLPLSVSKGTFSSVANNAYTSVPGGDAGTVVQFYLNWNQYLHLNWGFLHAISGWLTTSVFKLLFNVNHAFEKIFNFSFTLLGWDGNLASGKSPVHTLYSVVSSIGWSLLVIGIVIVAMQSMGHATKWSKVVPNIIMVALTITVLPLMMRVAGGNANTPGLGDVAQQSAKAVEKAKSDGNMSSDLALQPIQNNVIDLTTLIRNDWGGWKLKPDSSKFNADKWNAIDSAEDVHNIDLGQYLDKDTMEKQLKLQKKHAAAVQVMYYHLDDESKQPNGGYYIVKNTTMKTMGSLNDQVYSRYSINWTGLLGQSIILAVTLIVATFRVVEDIFELTAMNLVAPVLAYQSVRSTKKLRDLISSIVGLYLSLVLIILVLRLFFVFVTVASQKVPSNMNFVERGLLVAAIYAGGSYGMFKGISYFERITGVSQGFSDEFGHAMAAGAAAGFVGGAAGSLGGKAMSSIGSRISKAGGNKSSNSHSSGNSISSMLGVGNGGGHGVGSNSNSSQNSSSNSSGSSSTSSSAQSNNQSSHGLNSSTNSNSSSQSQSRNGGSQTANSQGGSQSSVGGNQNSSSSQSSTGGNQSSQGGAQTTNGGDQNNQGGDSSTSNSGSNSNEMQSSQSTTNDNSGDANESANMYSGSHGVGAGGSDGANGINGANGSDGNNGQTQGARGIGGNSQVAGSEAGKGQANGEPGTANGMQNANGGQNANGLNPDGTPANGTNPNEAPTDASDNPSLPDDQGHGLNEPGMAGNDAGGDGSMPADQPADDTGHGLNDGDQVAGDQPAEPGDASDAGNGDQPMDQTETGTGLNDGEPDAGDQPTAADEPANQGSGLNDDQPADMPADSPEPADGGAGVSPSEPEAGGVEEANGGTMAGEPAGADSTSSLQGGSAEGTSAGDTGVSENVSETPAGQQNANDSFAAARDALRVNEDSQQQSQQAAPQQKIGNAMQKMGDFTSRHSGKMMQRSESYLMNNRFNLSSRGHVSGRSSDHLD